MAKSGKRYSNQEKDQIIKHIQRLLKAGKRYDLKTDPLMVYFELRESARQPKIPSEKRTRLRREYANSSKKDRRLAGTRRRTSPKIRTSKKGRTVPLKGVSY